MVSSHPSSSHVESHPPLSLASGPSIGGSSAGMAGIEETMAAGRESRIHSLMRWTIANEPDLFLIDNTCHLPKVRSYWVNVSFLAYIGMSIPDLQDGYKLCVRDKTCTSPLSRDALHTKAEPLADSPSVATLWH